MLSCFLLKFEADCMKSLLRVKQANLSVDEGMKYVFPTGRLTEIRCRKILENYDWENSKLFQLCKGSLEEISAIMIFDLAKKGDAISKLIVNEIGKVNASGFANIVNAFDPELITVGGSIALNNPHLVLAPIKNGIDLYLINRKPKILLTPLGADVVLFGALALAIQSNIE